ncbi:hypothetical protein GCK32_009665, partial [Trichostrongylus colubriformis]
RVIGGLGAQSKKSVQTSRLHNDAALFYGDDVIEINPSCDDEIILPSDCEDVSRSGEEYSKSTSRSPLPTSGSIALSPLKEKRNQDTVTGRSESPSRICVDIPATSSAPSPTVAIPIVVTLKFENEGGEMFRPDKVVSFPRTATVASAEERFRSELAGSQVKSFDIRLSDGREADSDIPLLSLGEPLAIVCRLHKSTTETLYKNGTGGRHGRGDVLKYITKFDASGILDLSSAASGDVGLIVDVLKAVVDLNRSISSLVLDGCDLTNDVLSSLPLILPNVRQFSCRYTGFTDNSLAMLGLGSLSLHSVDLSHNEFTSGFAISHSLLSRCLQLSELRISDLEVGIGEEAFLTAICELPSLQVLDISFNSFVRGSTVESILSSCENLTSLRIDGCDLSGISFVSTWLPNLRELSMVGCCVTDFDSFVEWMSMGCIRRLDLSVPPNYDLTMIEFVYPTL